MPHIRRDPLTGRSVIFAPERAARPSDYARSGKTNPIHGCAFCAGNESETPPELLSYRDGDGQWTLRVVPNKYPALTLLPEAGHGPDPASGEKPAIGSSEVIIEAPEHDAWFAELPAPRIADLFRAYRDRVLALRSDGRLRSAMLFKNHGEFSGATLRHTHSQLAALPVVPQTLADELAIAEECVVAHGGCVYCAAIEEARRDGRTVAENPGFVAFCPYSPRAAFETWLLPKQHGARAEDPSEDEFTPLGELLKTVLLALEAVLDRPPWNLVLHSAPFGDETYSYYHWHVELIPRTTQLAGFEWGTGMYVNSTLPEEAAAQLRNCGVGLLRSDRAN